MKKNLYKSFFLIITLLLIMSVFHTFGENRFPRPEFKSEYELPRTTSPQPQDTILEYIALIILAAAIIVTGFFSIIKKSRKAILLITIFSFVYFGFYRKVCDCPVSSIQNIALSLFHPGYIIPLTIVLFFLIPLVLTLVMGRTFCASVCPLGVIQELVVFKPVHLPPWLNRILSIFPYIFSGLSVLAAATGSAFLVCQFDPFAGIYRLSSSFEMILFGVIVLVIGVFIGRPYCRFLCPYGVLLKWISKLSIRHATITDSDCIQCNLCEKACPYGAIEGPAPEKEDKDPVKGKKRLVFLLVISPVFIFLCGWLTSNLDFLLSQMHPAVRLSRQIQLELADDKQEKTLESEAFWKTGESVDSLFERTRKIINQYSIGGWILGIFIGLVICGKLVALSVKRKRDTYSINKGNCYSCGRCFEHCPLEREKVKKVVGNSPDSNNNRGSTEC